MTDESDPQPDPLLWSARRERARRWLHTDLKGYPTLREEEYVQRPCPRCGWPLPPLE